MRESLTVLAILLIVVLTTALVGPYFVDWNAHRTEIEARLASILDANVSVRGPIDLKLLPRPILRMQQLTVSGGRPGDGVVAADRVDLELALTALLHGEIRFVDAELTHPRVTLSIARNGSIKLPDLGPTDSHRVSLGHLAIHDGTITFVDEDARPALVVTGLQGDGEAESLLGPFKFAGRIDTPRGPLGFRLATGAADAGKIRLKTTLDAVAGSPKIDIEGTLVVASAQGAASSLAFDGSFTATGQVPVPADATLPWRLVGRAHAEPGLISATDMELRAGADERAMVASGTGRVDFGPDRSAHLAFKTRQIDVGKLAVASGESGDSTPPTLADELAGLKTFAGNPDAFSALPFPVTVDYSADTVTLGSQTLANLAGSATLAAGKPATGTVAIESGDGSRLRFDGSFEPGSAAVFKGFLEASTHDFGRLADQLALDAPEAGAWLKRIFPTRSVSFAGAVNLSAVGFSAQDVVLGLDRSSFTGTITLTKAVGGERARFFADLTSDALDLDSLPDLAGSAQATSDVDLSFTLAARSVRLARTDAGDVAAGRMAIDLNRTGAVTTLNRFSLTDLGSATADLTGRSDGQTAHLQGRFDARRLRDLAKLVGRLLPGPVTAGLEARADALSPMLLQVSADAAIAQDGTLVPTALSLDGTAAGTKLAFHLVPDAAPVQPDDPLAPFRARHVPVRASLLLDAPEAGALLRQIGIATLPQTAIGRGHIEASGRLSGSGGVDGTLTTRLADTVLTFKGRGSMEGDIAGKLTLAGPNVAPVLRAVTLANPDSTAVWPVDATTDLSWRDGRLISKGLSGQLIGTAFRGELSFVPDSSAGETPSVAGSEASTPAADVPALTGALTIDRLPLPVLAGLALGPLSRPKPGAVWPDTPWGASFLRLPRSDLALTVPTLPLNDTQTARDAKLTLRLGPGLVTLRELSATLGDGRIGATLTLRRDGAAASMSGQVDWSGLSLTTPSLGGRSSGKLELAGTGSSAAALVGGLAGDGSVSIEDARLPRFDPDAIGRVLASTDAAEGAIDDQQISQALDHELDRGATPLGRITVPVTIAAGVLRAESLNVDGPAVSAAASASLDLRTALWTLRSTATLREAPKDWTGNPPQVGILWRGPFAAPARAVDAAALVNGIEARAIAREQARIELFQDDVRERAFFARRLKAIEAEQQSGRDKARADAEGPKGSTSGTKQPGTSGAPDNPAVRPPGANGPGAADGAPTAPVPGPRAPGRRSSVPGAPLGLGPGQTSQAGVPPSGMDPATAGRY